jgi:hypothetical protein
MAAHRQPRVQQGLRLLPSPGNQRHDHLRRPAFAEPALFEKREHALRRRDATRQRHECRAAAQLRCMRYAITTLRSCTTRLVSTAWCAATCG